jgi:hypothetical protein
MLGTNQVKNYFEQNPAQVLPMLSAEWNYNLLYIPYATFSGKGENLYYPGSSWSNAGSSLLSIISANNGKTTTAFTNAQSTRFVVNATSISERTSFEGAAKITLSGLPSGANCYKVIFYARSLDNNKINLSAQISNSSPASHLSGSTYKTIDNYNWQQITVVAGTSPNDIAFNTMDLTLDFNNSTLSNTGQWGFEICHIEVYKITYFDYSYGRQWTTDSAFTYFRPGESYVTSGNASTPSLTRYATLSSSKWNNALPCSGVTYSPRILFSSDSSPLYRNGVLSPFSQYKYFVSEVPSGPTSIGAVYEEVMNVNKLVLKFNVSQSKIYSGTVTLYHPAITTPVASITISPSMVDASGTLILYYKGTGGINNSGWDTNKWAWAPDSSSLMPGINQKTGKITISQQINKVVLTQSTAEITKPYSSAATYSSELQRLQVIEISPRLELDLTPFVLSMDLSKELDNKSTPLPISSMSANTATVILSNIPISGPNNVPYSIFSNNANDTSVFVSQLKNLFVKNVKIYTNFYIPKTSVDSQANRVIPGGVFYVDSWDNNDIKQIKINAFDVMKFLQTLPVTDYVSHSQTLVNVIRNIMEFAGFTDYNYDELVSVIIDNNQKIVTNFFFADGANKTVYDVLREAFLAFQIGASVDEFGVMRFVNLRQVISNNIPNYVINDKNIVIDTYRENIKVKPGKLIMRYRIPQIKTSVGIGSNDTKTTSSLLLQSPDIIWKQETEDLVPFNYLGNSITTFSQNYYQIDPKSLLDPFYLTTFDHNAYAIIEGEIISTGDKEISLSNQDKNVSYAQTRLVSIANQNDLTAAISSFASDISTPGIYQHPTGRFLNVERGLFNTKAKPHIVVTNSAEFATKFKYGILSGNQFIPGSNLSPNTAFTIPVPFMNGTKSIVYPANDSDTGTYNTYSAKFRLPTSTVKSGSMTAGIFFNMNLSNSAVISSSYYTVEIETQATTTGSREYTLIMNQVLNGIKTQIFTTPITNYINGDNYNEPKIASYGVKNQGVITLKAVVDLTIDNKIIIYVNKHRITPILSFNKTTGKTTYMTGGQHGASGSKFGFLTFGDSTISNSTELVEIYACESSLDDKIDYHFQGQPYLDSIVAGQGSVEKFSMNQVQPSIIGLNIYDVQPTITPSLGADPYKVMYSYYYSTGTVQNAPSDFIQVEEDALAYSTIINTGFRLKFAVVNNSPFAVYTRTGSEYTNSTQAQLTIASSNMILLGNQETIERVLSPQNANEVVELHSDWVQSKKSASSILGVVSRANDAFSRDITVSIFGNPLVQVGDIISLSYSLKNIKNITYFVQAVKHTFKQGLQTDLVLNQIGYTDNTVITSLLDTFPQLANLSAGAYGLTVFPNTGSTRGGDTVTITGFAGLTPSLLPTIYFGPIADNKIGTSITYVDASTITCTTPPSSTESSVPIYGIVNGITYSTTQYQSYTYNAGASVSIGTISPSIVDVQQQNGTYSIYISWSPGSVNENGFSWTSTGGPWAGANNVPEILGDPFKIIVDGAVAGQTYTFTITPLNIQNSVVVAKGTPVTLSWTPGGGSSDIKTPPSITVDSTVYSGSLTNTTAGQVDITVSSSNLAGAPDFYHYEWYKYEVGVGQVFMFGEKTNSPTHTTTRAVAGEWVEVYAENFYGFSSIVTINYNDMPIDKVLGKPNPNGRPAGANVSSATFDSGTNSLRFTIVPDTTANAPTDYMITLSPARNGSSNETLSYPVTQMTKSGANYLIIIPNAQANINYAYVVDDKNAAGTGLVQATGNISSGTSGYPTINAPVLTGNLSFSWTGNAFYSSYQVVMTNETKGTSSQFTYVPNGLTINYPWYGPGGVGDTVSTNGINFIENYYNNGTYFSPGDVARVDITPMHSITTTQPPMPGQKVSAKYTIAGGGGFITPVGKAPVVHALNYHYNVTTGVRSTPAPGGCFIWTDTTSYNPSPISSVSSWYWHWEFYSGKTSASGTPTSSGNKYPGSPTIPAINQFYVTTSNTGNEYLRVRAVMTGTDSNTYYGPWSGATNVFT